MDSRSRGLTAKAENDNRFAERHPWGRDARTATRGSIHFLYKITKVNNNCFYRLCKRSIIINLKKVTKTSC